MYLDRRVCFAGFVLSEMEQAINNILEHNPGMDVRSLRSHIKDNIKDYNFLNPIDVETKQLWVNLQYGYTSRSDTDKDLNEVTHVLLHNVSFHRQAVSEAQDFTYSGFNYAIFKASEAVWNCMKSGAGQEAWEEEEIFNSKVDQAYQQQSLISDCVLTTSGLQETLVENNHLLETNASSENYDSDIESVYEPWDVNDTLLEAIFNCNLSGSQAIKELHEIKKNKREVINNNTELETSTELAPASDSFNSKIDTSSSSANNILHGTETSASLEFLYDEATLDHFLSTCIKKFDLLSQFTANGVCGFFIAITRFIYSLYRLNFFFLWEVKIKRFMKWWRKKFD
jgi:hypothetical protein